MESLIAPAALAYAALAALPACFQVALAAGAPWGRLTLGGAHPGRLPRHLRRGAAIQAMLLASMALVMLARGGVVALAIAPWAGWLALGFTVLSAVASLITPSRPERRVWAPVMLGLCLCGAIVVWPG